MENDVVEIVNELSSIFKQIEGVKSIKETFAVSYLVITKDKQSKENTEKVSVALKKQAEKYDVDLDVLVLEEEEFENAKNEFDNSLYAHGAGLTAIKIDDKKGS